MTSLTLDWKADLTNFMNLLNRKCIDEEFKILDIETCAEKIKRDYPTRVEPFFYLMRLYRNIREYAKARIELDIIYRDKAKWQDAPSWMIGSELLFEESLLAYYYENNKERALGLTIDYLNHADCMNDVFAMENLYFFCESMAQAQAQTAHSEVYQMNLPSLGAYHASSVNYMDLSGEDLLCVRYVNYNIDDDGMYDCNEFNTCNMIIYKNKLDILENIIELPKYSSPYRGIEDIRLYRSVSGKINFVGTQQEWVCESDVNRIMWGEVELDQGKCELNGKAVIESPENAPCEKNWIPWVNSRGEEYFIYWWRPFKIGRRVRRVRQEQEQQTLEIVSSRDVPQIFGYFRGSSNIEYFAPNNEYWTVVHFVHKPLSGEGTRRYYHCLVIFKEDSASGLLYPISYSVPFTFLFSGGKRGIEYCMGFSLSAGSYARFWVSRMDSDPHRLDIPLTELNRMLRPI